MTAAAFLAGRELRRRPGRAALAAAVVAGAVALSVGLELLGRARERAVEATLDAAGPALRILPAGASAADAAALRVAGALPADAEAAARGALRGGVRRVERRAVLRDPETGTAILAVHADAPRRPAPGRVLLGAGLAERGVGAGAVRVLGRSFVATGAAAPAADATDYAIFARAEDVGAPPANELRVFLEPGVAPRDAEQALRAALPGASVVRSDRGEVADGGLQASIAAHRRAVQLVTAAVAALALLVAAHLDAAERRRELALLAAIGFSRRALAAVVVLRAAACAAAGAVAGLAVAAALAAAWPGFLAGPLAAIGAAAVALSSALAALAAAPAALVAAAADPVAELQEG